MNVSPLVWISFGLTSLTLSVMLAGDALVDLVPNHDRQDFEYRRDVAEALAVQYSALAEHQQIETIKLSMTRFAQRNPEIRSLALVLQSGEVLAQIGDHTHIWVPPSGGASSLEFLQVPIFAGNQSWGVLQIAFRKADVSEMERFLNDPWMRFLIFVSVMGFIGYLVFMKRTLRQLDPSGIVPTRVKAALDALTQGVVMIDTRDLIVLTNETFSRSVGKPLTALIGTDLGAIAWKFVGPGDSPTVFPWTRAIMEKQPQDNIPLALHGGGGAF
ncbi:MAG TPA: hypothetical protein PLO50_07355, partial [Nitrospira sp.]|nr:hypothetical protein [Nitrospira sp.]